MGSLDTHFIPHSRQRLTGGIVNTMILFHHDDDTDLDEALVFRINRDYSDIMGHTEDGDIPGHISRDREFMAFQVKTPF